MTLRQLQVGSSEFSSSVVLDSSKVGGTVVTVAVATTREEEIDILDSFYENDEGLGLKPFYHKTNDFGYDDMEGFCGRVIEDNEDFVAAFVHDIGEDGNTNAHQIEAVHPALHVHETVSGSGGNEPLVIVDGGANKAEPFFKAISGLRDDIPTIAHCLQSEYYYPNALLADVSAGYLAYTIEKGEQGVVAPSRAKSEYSDKWGKAFSSLHDSRVVYSPPDAEGTRGDTVKERIRCRYHGSLALDPGSEKPMSDSLTPVVNSLRKNGYERVANIFDEL